MAQKETAKPRQLIQHRSNSFVEIYANSVTLNVSLFDFEFTLGKILVADEKKLEVEQKASVSMSPQHAKELLRILSDNIRTYESKYGSINSAVPPRMIETKKAFDA